MVITLQSRACDIGISFNVGWSYDAGAYCLWPIYAYMWRYSIPTVWGTSGSGGRLRAARDGKEACYEPLLTVVQDFLLPCLRCKKAALKCHWFFVDKVSAAKEKSLWRLGLLSGCTVFAQEP